MKKFIVYLFIFTSIFLSKNQSTYGENLTGTQIMTRWDEREDGDDQVSEAVFTLMNKRGKKRVRKTVRYWKDFDGKDSFDEKMIMFFRSPADVKNTGFLNWSFIDTSKADDKWLYLPALKKIKRISSGDKEDSFMGTDFTFDDMGDRQVQEDTHTLIKEEILNGKPCFVVENVPKESDYMYSKKLTWIDKDQWIDHKTEFYDRKGRHLKTLNLDWQQVNNIWTPKRLFMENHHSGHSTEISIKEIKFNTGIKDSFYKKNQLKKGVRR